MLKIFVFIDIWFVKQDIQKWLKTKICSFYGEFENEKKKGQKKLFFWSGNLNPGFSVIFLPMIWIFMKSEEDEIKSKQAYKKDRTLWGQIKLLPNEKKDKNLDEICQNLFLWRGEGENCIWCPIKLTKW